MRLVIECSSEPLSLGEGQRAWENQEELWWTNSILLPRFTVSMLLFYPAHVSWPSKRLMGTSSKFIFQASAMLGISGEVIADN